MQLPGRESRVREPALTNLALIAKTIANVLRPHFDLPFAFFGHSMGGLLCYELTRQLSEEGLPGPVHLFVSAYRAPQLRDRDPQLHKLPDSIFFSQISALHSMPEEFAQNRELMQVFLPTLRADFEACETYVYLPRPPLRCPISAYGGLQDMRVSREELLHWRAQTRDDFYLRMFPGDHFFLCSCKIPVLQVLSQELTRSATRMSKA